MPEEDESTGELKESVVVFGMIFVAHDQSSEVMQPCKEPFDLPAFAVAAQPASIVESGLGAALPVRCNQEHVLVEQSLPQRVAVVGLVSNQTQRLLLHQAFFQGGLHQFYFRRRSSLRVNGERKTMSISNCHDFDTLAPLGFADFEAPFLAAAKLPSMKHSDKSKPPRS